MLLEVSHKTNSKSIKHTQQVAELTVCLYLVYMIRPLKRAGPQAPTPHLSIPRKKAHQEELTIQHPFIHPLLLVTHLSVESAGSSLDLLSLLRSSAGGSSACSRCSSSSSRGLGCNLRFSVVTGFNLIFDDFTGALHFLGGFLCCSAGGSGSGGGGGGSGGGGLGY